MNTSLSWIKMYVPDLGCDSTGIYRCHDTDQEQKWKASKNWMQIWTRSLIGQIDKIEKHPDADKLIICQVNIGTESVQIVTGAPNVKEGDKVPVVLDGGRVAGGHDWKEDSGWNRD